MNSRETDFWNERSGPRITPEHFNDIVATAADLAIVLDLTGKVRSVVVNPLNPTLGRLDHWTNRNIREFLAEDSVPKMEAQLDARQGDSTDIVDAIEVNHFDNANWEFPIRYTLHRTGQDDSILMLGRDLRPVAELQNRLVKAQLALEKDYETHRDFETRYRVIMETARDPFVLVDVNTGRVIDINSSAAQMLGAESNTIVNGAFTQEFEGRRRGEFIEALANGAGGGGSGPVSAETKRGKKQVAIYPTLFRAAGDRVLLCRLESAGSAEFVAEELAMILSSLYRDGADAMVFTDTHGQIRYANDAFLSLCDAGTTADVRGKSFGDFMARGSVDLKVLMDNAARSGKMRVYSTRLESTYGGHVAVEISTTHLAGASSPGFAFVLRDTSRMEVVRETADHALAGGMSEDAMHNVMDLVGSAPLKDIVAATTDVVEKMCIETAVELTDNNRVAAAEMLGLSRQSLYVKLRKYGLINKDGDD